MNTSLDYIEQLARQARIEAAPQGDVRGKVLDRLEESPKNSWVTPFAVMTTGYAAVAAMALFFAYNLMTTLDDPVSSIIQTASVITPM